MEGIIGRKLGMTQRFNEDGTLDSVTVIEAGPCTVTQVKTVEKDGYQAVQLGFAETNRLNKPEKGHLQTLRGFRCLKELRVEDLGEVKRGAQIDVSIFQTGDKVDVTGISKGRGFAGAVKRHHFRGGPKTHGQSDRHRAPGSIGAGTTPGRVLKGKRMAGHMGDQRVTTRNLTVAAADTERGLLLVKGSVPGALNGLVVVKKAKASR